MIFMGFMYNVMKPDYRIRQALLSFSWISSRIWFNAILGYTKDLISFDSSIWHEVGLCIWLVNLWKSILIDVFLWPWILCIIYASNWSIIVVYHKYIKISRWTLCIFWFNVISRNLNNSNMFWLSKIAIP